MPRLLRPHISVETRCRVVLRQLGEMFPDSVIEANRRHLGHLLRCTHARLADLLGCDLRLLRLDHDPALALREKIFKNGVHVGYKPDACDPEYLIYRTAHGHHIKTNVRGDGAQFPDRVLIKRERKRQRKKVGKVTKPTKRWPKRKLGNNPNFAWPKRSFCGQRKS